MATTITRYVDPDSAGGNGTTTALSGSNAAYASLNAAMTAEARNLVTADEIAEFICMSSHANHTADTVLVNQSSGWTTDATRYVDIKTDAASHHAGVWSDTKYRIVVNADPDADPGVVQLSFPYGRSTGIQVKNTWTGAGNPKAAYFGYGTSGHWRVSKNILVGGSGANIVNSGGYFFNNILYYFSGATRGTGVIRGNGGSWQVYNNTAVDFHLDIIMGMTVVRRRLILSTTLAKETRPISKRVGVGLRALDTTPQVMARLRERIPERAKHSLSRPVQTIIISLLMTRGQGIMV